MRPARRPSASARRICRPAPDTGPLLRTILRLRHDVVMIGRASVVPLPANLQARLAAPLADVSEAIVGYLRSVAALVAQRRRCRRRSQPVDEALQAYARRSRRVAQRRPDPRPARRCGRALLRAGIFAGADAAESEAISSALHRGMVRDAAGGQAGTMRSSWITRRSLVSARDLPQQARARSAGETAG